MACVEQEKPPLHAAQVVDSCKSSLAATQGWASDNRARYLLSQSLSFGGLPVRGI